MTGLKIGDRVRVSGISPPHDVGVYDGPSNGWRGLSWVRLGQPIPGDPRQARNKLFANDRIIKIEESKP